MTDRILEVIESKVLSHIYFTWVFLVIRFMQNEKLMVLSKWDLPMPPDNFIFFFF